MASCAVCGAETTSALQLCRICAERTTGSLNIASLRGAIRVAAAIKAERAGRGSQAALPREVEEVGNPLRRPTQQPGIPALTHETPASNPPPFSRPRSRPETLTATALSRDHAPPAPAVPASPPRASSRAVARALAEHSQAGPGHTDVQRPARAAAAPRQRATRRPGGGRLVSAMLLVLIIAAGVMSGALAGISQRMTEAGAQVADALATHGWLLRLPRLTLLVAIIAVATCLDWALQGPRTRDDATVPRRVASLVAFGVAWLIILTVGASDYATSAAAQRANLWLYLACAVVIVTAADNYRFVTLRRRS